MPNVLVRRRPLVRYDEGVHLNFKTGKHYVKGRGAPAQVAPFTSLFTFTGDALSYYRAASGLLVPSVANTPRIEYDAAGNLLGLLVEATRTNLGLYSNDLTNAAWVKSNTTAAKTSTGPDGVASSASRLTASAGNGTCLQSVTSGSATRAYSVWLKRITGTGNVDLTVDNASTWTTKTITSDWTRVDISQAAVTNPIFGIRIVTSADAVDVWCNQLESAAFPSSAIPTTTGSVARAAETCARTLGAEFSATAGTVLAVGRSSGGQDAAANQFAFSIDDGTLNEEFRLVRNTGTDTAQYAVIDGAGAQAALTGTFANATAFKAALAWTASDFALSFNGAAVSTDAAGTLPTVTTLNLQCGPGGGSPMIGHIRTFHYWPERKANAELVRLAT